MLILQPSLYVFSQFCGKEELEEEEIICPYCQRCVEATCYCRCPHCGNQI